MIQIISLRRSIKSDGCFLKTKICRQPHEIEKIMRKQAGYIKFKHKPTPEEIQKANEFSKKVDKTNQYAEKRNQTNPVIRISQNAIGKLAEIAFSRWIIFLKRTILKDVDWEIHSKEDKDWSSDIIVTSNRGNPLNCSVKSSPVKYGGQTEYMDGEKIPATLGRQYTYSVQLKNNDGNGGTDTGKHDRYILCNWDDVNKEMEVYAWLDAKLVPEMMIKPFKKELKEIKGCIMMETCGGLRNFPCGIDELIRRQSGA